MPDPKWEALAKEFTRGLFAVPRTEDGWDQVAASLADLLERVAGDGTKSSDENFRKVEDRYIDEIRDYVLRLASAREEIAQEHQRANKWMARVVNADHEGSAAFQHGKEEGRREQREIQEMRLCESGFLILKPNQLYHFTVDPDCKNCVNLSRGITGHEGESKP